MASFIRLKARVGWCATWSFQLIWPKNSNSDIYLTGYSLKPGHQSSSALRNYSRTNFYPHLYQDQCQRPWMVYRRPRPAPWVCASKDGWAPYRQFYTPGTNVNVSQELGALSAGYCQDLSPLCAEAVAVGFQVLVKTRSEINQSPLVALKFLKNLFQFVNQI